MRAALGTSPDRTDPGEAEPSPIIDVAHLSKSYGDQIAVRGAWRSYRGVRGVRTVLIEGAGHSPMFERPGPTAEAILAFARRVQGR